MLINPALPFRICSSPHLFEQTVPAILSFHTSLNLPWAISFPCEYAIFFYLKYKLGVVVHTCNPNIREAKRALVLQSKIMSKSSITKPPELISSSSFYLFVLHCKHLQFLFHHFLLRCVFNPYAHEYVCLQSPEEDRMSDPLALQF